MYAGGTLNQTPSIAGALPRSASTTYAPSETDLTQVDLSTLERRCATEGERFYRGQTHDTRYAYELFRRALVERDEAAWAVVYQQYYALVESWVRRSGAFASSGETGEFFVVLAFTRFWQAISAERFASFATLAALLHYLQLCAGCVVIDSVRSQSWAEVLPEHAIPQNHGGHTSPDEEAMSRVNRAEFWNYINAQMNNEAERVVILNSFVLGMKPGDIYAQRPDLFDNVNEVYNVKRNVLGRLSRNQELRGMFAMM